MTNFYADSGLAYRVSGLGHVNPALRQVLSAKNDALTEPWWVLTFVNDGGLDQHIIGGTGALFDYQ